VDMDGITEVAQNGPGSRMLHRARVVRALPGRMLRGMATGTAGAADVVRRRCRDRAFRPARKQDQAGDDHAGPKGDREAANAGARERWPGRCRRRRAGRRIPRGSAGRRRPLPPLAPPLQAKTRRQSRRMLATSHPRDAASSRARSSRPTAERRSYAYSRSASSWWTIMPSRAPVPEVVHSSIS